MSKKSENQNSITPGFGIKLKEQRELREISLEEISKVTKISGHLLYAMEEENWDTLPGGIFTRNFIRLYTDHLGLDSDRWVEDYKQYRKQLSKFSSEQPEEGNQLAGEEEFPRVWIYTLLALIIVSLVGGYFFIAYNMKSNVEESVAPGELSQPQQALPVTSDETVSVSNPETSQVTTGLTVELLETRAERCWFMLWKDETHSSPEGGENLLKDRVYTITAETSVRLVIAHLSGVELTVNGKQIAWEIFNPQPSINDEGTVLSYDVTITLDAVQ